MSRGLSRLSTTTQTIELSVTIAVGSSLLFLNILDFAVISYETNRRHRRGNRVCARDDIIAPYHKLTPHTQGQAPYLKDTPLKQHAPQ